MRVFKESDRDTAERLDSFIERMAPTAELVQLTAKGSGESLTLYFVFA